MLQLQPLARCRSCRCCNQKAAVGVIGIVVPTAHQGVTRWIGGSLAINGEQASRQRPIQFQLQVGLVDRLDPPQLARLAGQHPPVVAHLHPAPLLEAEHLIAPQR